jgi:hypothetical protein
MGSFGTSAAVGIWGEFVMPRTATSVFSVNTVGAHGGLFLTSEEDFVGVEHTDGGGYGLHDVRGEGYTELPPTGPAGEVGQGAKDAKGPCFPTTGRALEGLLFFVAGIHLGFAQAAGGVEHPIG